MRSMTRLIAVGVMTGSVGVALPTASHAQGGFAVSGYAGRGTVDLGFASNDANVFGGGMTYTFGGGDKGSAFIGSGGLTVRYFNTNPTLFGKVSGFEFGTPLTIGFRIGNAGLGGAMEYRRIMRSEEHRRYGQVGNAQVLLYGPYLKIGLGPLGSTTGRFALEGRYLFGYGYFTEFDTARLVQQGVIGDRPTLDMKDPSELRLALSYLASPKLLLRLEYQESKFLADPASSGRSSAPRGSLDQKNRTLGLTFGLVM